MIKLPAWSLERTGLTLATGIAGGLLFWLISVPLAWLTGSAAAVATLSLAGKRLEVPYALRQIAIVLIGAMLGAAVTPEALALLPRWPVTIAGLAAALMTIMLGGSYYLQRVHGFDRATARLACMPGAITQVMALAIESNADARRVTIIQIMRLLSIVLLLPSFAGLLGIPMSSNLAPPGSSVIVHEVVIQLVLAGCGAYLFNRLGVPAPTFIGAMAMTALLYGSGLLTTALPDWLMLGCFVVIGAMIGTNFVGTDVRVLTSTFVAGLGSLAVCSLGALLWAAPLAWLMGLSPVQVWLAYSPGGVETSAILAMALGLDVAFVSSHHVVRVLMLNLMLPWWIVRDRAASDDEEEAAPSFADGRYQ